MGGSTILNVALSSFAPATTQARTFATSCGWGWRAFFGGM
jgi:hypothetical protein